MYNNNTCLEKQYVYQPAILPGFPVYRYLQTPDGLVFDGIGEIKTPPMTPLVEVKSPVLSSLVIKDISADIDEDGQREITLDEYREKLENCRKQLAIFKNVLNGTKYYVPISCKDRFCNNCARRRAERARTFMTMVFDQWPEYKNKNQLSFITFTCENFPSEMLREGFSMFTVWLRRLKQRKIWRNNVKGGVASYEVTKGRDGRWNLHLHVLARANYIPQHELQEAWRKIVEKEWRGYIVHIEVVKNTRRSLNEICKYPFKSGDSDRHMTIEDRFLLTKVFAGRRMFSFLGEWYSLLKAFDCSMQDLYKIMVGNEALAELLKSCVYVGTVHVGDFDKNWNPEAWRYDPDLGVYIVD